MTTRVGSGDAGERADKVVAGMLGVSRSVARRLFEEGRVTVEGAVVEPRTRLDLDSRVRVEVPPPEPTVAPERVPFTVRHEDRHLAVIDKPAGVVVHPGAGRRRGTLVAGLLSRWPDLEGVGEEHRWGLVHRLDRETSGLLVVARTQEVHDALREMLRQRRIEREYLALVRGRLQTATGTVDAPIARDPRRPTRRAVRSDGRPARTHYRRRSEWEGATLLEVRLETGRTHQIRVHLASIGHPVAGDRAYGGGGLPEADPGRVWLHAARLSLVHPVTGEELEVTAPLPPELEASLRALGPPVEGSPAL